jgi:hypothetical protein
VGDGGVSQSSCIMHHTPSVDDHGRKNAIVAIWTGEGRPEVHLIGSIQTSQNFGSPTRSTI